MYNYYDYDEDNLLFINDDIINSINYRLKLGLPIRLVLKNTAILDSDILNKFPDTDLLQFRIIGGLNKEKYNSHKYKNRTTYSLRDIKHIIYLFEKIEKTVDPIWSELKKAQYIYNILVNYMYTDFEHEKHDYDIIQSLRALINGSGVCAGFSLIYKELMDRQV